MRKISPSSRNEIALILFGFSVLTTVITVIYAKSGAYTLFTVLGILLAVFSLLISLFLFTPTAALLSKLKHKRVKTVKVKPLKEKPSLEEENKAEDEDKNKDLL